VLVAKGAKKVGLVGDFNGWQPDVTQLENSDGQGTFVVTLPLKRGAYEYMFNVDGQWVTDPSAAERRPDGFGRSNGVLRL
jgi:1,4-alpha-glucan branching enzyme